MTKNLHIDDFATDWKGRFCKTIPGQIEDLNPFQRLVMWKFIQISPHERQNAVIVHLCLFSIDRTFVDTAGA
jgi:hypothetical protein